MKIVYGYLFYFFTIIVFNNAIQLWVSYYGVPDATTNANSVGLFIASLFVYKMKHSKEFIIFLDKNNNKTSGSVFVIFMIFAIVKIYGMTMSFLS